MTALALAPDTRIRYEPAAAAGVDRAIRVSTAIAVLAVAGVAAYVSYWHAYAVVCAHGETGVTARLELATIDGLVYASSMVNLMPRGTGSPSPPWPAGCSPSASSRRWPRTWPRAGPTARSARSSQPGPQSASWGAMSSWSGSSGPQPRDLGRGPATDHSGPQADHSGTSLRLAAAQEPDAGPGSLIGPVAGLTPCGADSPPPAHGMTGAGQVGRPGWNAAGHADQMADQSSGSPGPVTAAGPDGDINAAAVAAYRASLQTGRPLSERKLAGQFGKTSRRWAGNRMAEARHRPSAERVGIAGETLPVNNVGGVSIDAGVVGFSGRGVASR